jgi:metal-responsive CopG/Arc/MetJ family transcriptional regulator
MARPKLNKHLKGFMLSKPMIALLDSASSQISKDRSEIVEEALREYLPQAINRHKDSLKKINDSMNQSTM